MSASPPAVLVLRALGLGDLLASLPALRALRDAFPGHRLCLAAPAPLAPIAALSGAVDELVAHPGLEALPPQVHAPDVAVNLHGRGPTSTELLTATRPRRLVAFAHPAVPGTAGLPAWRDDEHEVARWCGLLERSGIPADPSRVSLPPPPVAVPEGARGATVVHPGAASRARQWPPSRFAAVARAEAGAGRPVVITGAASEVALARRVAAAAGLPPDAVLAGRTDLLGLAAVVAVAGRVVCGDTGVAHLASAFGTPSVILFGPVPPSRWGPPPGPHRTLWAGTVGDPHDGRRDPGLLRIRVADVLAVLAELPERVPG